MSVDVIVVGAGSAGGIVATRLAERGVEVLLLEAGPDFPVDVPPLLTTDLRIPVLEYDWGYVAQDRNNMPLPRGRTVGGSSATNAVAAVRAQPADWDAWGIEEWSYENVKAAESRFESDKEFGDEPYHGSEGPIVVERPSLDEAPLLRACVDAALAAGYKSCPDNNAPNATGVGPQAFNATNGERQSTLVTFIKRARKLRAFTLRADTHVNKVMIRNGVAIGVELADGSIIEASRIVLSAGALATPLILMRSGIGDAAHLKEHGIDVIEDLPVGDNFMDHPALPGVLAMAKDPAVLPDDLLARFMIRHSFSGKEGLEDVHMFGPFTGRSVRVEMPPGGFVISSFAAKTRSKGTVRLTSADPIVPPACVVNYFSGRSDEDALVNACRAIHEIMQTEPLASMIESIAFPAVGVDEDELRSFIRMGAITDHHECGTAPIGAVLDPHLKVNGIENLYVCDASIMPDNPRANTNFPTMTIAERFIELFT
ncbi:MAG: GMC family oxidoreductase [Actinomycetota bacterium]